jgi:NAD(P)-dependent dehydrogenase (short-subunit alcohol dehydrogenase family)
MFMSVVLITGCSTGFGLEFVRAFARRGDTVVATVRNPDRADGLKSTIADQALSNVVIRQLDVNNGDSVQRAVASTIKSEGRIDVLVNNAGIGAVSPLETLDEAVLRQVFETNVFGAVAVTRAALPHMRTQRSGRIIFTNAIGGILNTPYLGAYCSSKHAIDCIAATWDIELRQFGIRVTSVMPSAFQTAFAGNMDASFAEGTEYEAPAREYYEGLKTRIENGPTDLSPVANAVIDAATSPEPRQRYLIAPHLASVLDPLIEKLEEIHQREAALAPQGKK